MSRSNIEKQLSPAKRAWKRFASAVQKKLHQLKKSKTITKTTTTFVTVLRRAPAGFRRKKRNTIRRTSSALRIRPKKHQFQPSYAPVYVEELFVQHAMAQMTNKINNMDKVGGSTDPGSSSNLVRKAFDIDIKKTMRLNEPTTSELGIGSKMEVEKNNNNVLNCTSSSTFQLRGVDQRAEEFITKFKQEMRLQRQNSFGEFQERLARGS